MFQSLTIVGRLGRDPEMRYTPQGKPVTNFSVAVDDGFGENKSTLWFRVSAWDKNAENCNQYLHKGSKVLVSGRLVADKATGGPRVYESNGEHRASFEMSAFNVIFMSGKGDGDQAPAAQSDDDVPF